MNSNLQSTEDSIDAQAARWVIRLDQAVLPPDDRSSFESWIDADIRHKGAFIRAQLIYDLAGRVPLEDLSEAVRPDLRAPPRTFQFRRRTFLGGAAAAVAAGLLAFYIKTDASPTFYSTERGETRSLPLEDGSVITMNTDSAVSLRFTSGVREIKLERGEALFDVAKDAKRPFIVMTGNTFARAVGTSFLVRSLDNQPVELIVREGVVEMYRQVEADKGPSLLVKSHSLARTSEVPVPSVKMIDTELDDAAISRYLAWQQGMISFNGESLAKAATEFNRYSDVQIIVEDPQTASRTVTGLFSVHNPVEFARTVAVSLKLNIKVSANRVMLWQ